MRSLFWNIYISSVFPVTVSPVSHTESCFLWHFHVFLKVQIVILIAGIKVIFKPALMKLAYTLNVAAASLKARDAHCYFGNCAFTVSSMCTCLDERLRFFFVSPMFWYTNRRKFKLHPPSPAYQVVHFLGGQRSAPALPEVHRVVADIKLAWHVFTLLTNRSFSAGYWFILMVLQPGERAMQVDLTQNHPADWDKSNDHHVSFSTWVCCIHCLLFACLCTEVLCNFNYIMVWCLKRMSMGWLLKWKNSSCHTIEKSAFWFT